MPAKNKRSKSAHDREVRARATAAAAAAPAAAQVDAPMPEAPAPAPARVDDLITTKATFDVAVYGEVYAVTTHLTGALLGKAIPRLRNSAWPGYSDGYSASSRSHQVRRRPQRQRRVPNAQRCLARGAHYGRAYAVHFVRLYGCTLCIASCPAACPRRNASGERAGERRARVSGVG